MIYTFNRFEYRLSYQSISGKRWRGTVSSPIDLHHGPGRETLDKWSTMIKVPGETQHVSRIWLEVQWSHKTRPDYYSMGMMADSLANRTMEIGSRLVHARLKR